MPRRFTILYFVCTTRPPFWINNYSQIRVYFWCKSLRLRENVAVVRKMVESASMHSALWSQKNSSVFEKQTAMPPCPVFSTTVCFQSWNQSPMHSVGAQAHGTLTLIKLLVCRNVTCVTQVVVLQDFNSRESSSSSPIAAKSLSENRDNLEDSNGLLSQLKPRWNLKHVNYKARTGV